MTITGEVSFSLERFELTGAGALRVGGAWNGVEGRMLGEPALIVLGADRSERLVAVEGILGNLRHWSATFPWDGEAAAIQRAELELGGRFLIELPGPPSAAGHRRFGRTVIAAKEIAPHAPKLEGDVLSIHSALVAARDEAAAAIEALESSQVAVERARDEARRERSRREGDAARSREALDSLRQLAESSLEKERAVTKQLSAEMSELDTALAGVRAAAAVLRDERDAAIGERDQLTAKLREDAAVLERFQAALDEGQQLSTLAAEQAHAEFDRLHEVLRENQRAAEAAQAANARLLERARDAEREAGASRDEADALRAELTGSRNDREEAERLRSEMAGVQRAAEAAQTEADRLRRRLAAVRAVLEQQPTDT